MNLVYDVETSGIPDWKKPSNDPSQPHIIQIAAILCDDAGIEIERMNVFIKPEGWELPPEITTLTGIMAEQLESQGIPIADAIEKFLALWRKAKLTIAHNDSFDRRVLRIEMARLFGNVDVLEQWKNFPAFCTMNYTKNIVKMPPTAKMEAAGFNSFKPPKLEEAYLFFFGKKPAVSHDAMADVESTLAIYFKCKEAA